MKKIVAGALLAATMANFSGRGDEASPQTEEPRVGVVEHCEGDTPVFYDEGPDAFEMAPGARVTRQQAEGDCKTLKKDPQKQEIAAPMPALGK